MAENALSFVLNEVYQVLKEEANLQQSVHDQFVDIKDELESIQAFIKDADRRAADEGDTDQSIKAWVKQVREASFDIEDAIDEYLIYVAQKTHHRSGFIASLKNVSHLIKTLKPRHRIASQIQDLKLQVHKIKERSERYKLQSSLEQGSRDCRGTQSFKWHDARLGSLFIQEAEVVGFEYPRDQLVDWLTNGAAIRTVISVVGMGGLGKTTLANNVFHHNMVKSHFDSHAFITVSQTYTTESLLKDMVKQLYRQKDEPLPQGFNTMDHMSLVTEARRYLQEKRYVIVFDDVWKVEFWDEIQLAMLDNNIGSRIIITTRNLEVAKCCKKSSLVQVHMLQPLPPNKAWELFCKKAFQFDFDGSCPSELEDISREVVQKCEGLPLAIVAIGGLLLTKDKTVSEWKKLRQNLRFELERNPHLASLTRILTLSYDDLPYYLKSCVLYFGMYPEDYSIRCTRMVRQWVAEGFVIYDEENKTLEEIAKEYLMELVHRSLVQVSEVNYDGRPSSCRIHDLLREMMIRKMKDISFCRVLHENEQHVYDRTTRRLSIATSSSDVLMGIKQSHMRSMYMFEAGKLPQHFLSTFFSKSKLLKVLDLESASLDYVPDSVGNIFHLKFFSLRRTKVRDLPKSIGKLLNLETLDLKETQVQKLPRDIKKLTKLRHLIVCCRRHEIFHTMQGETGVQMEEGIGCMKFLQTLYHVEADHGGLDLILELKMLRQLRKLGLKNVRREYGKALCDSIKEMKCLESLNICAITEDEIIDLQFISSPPQLHRLHLFGRLEKLPEWVLCLHSLVRLSIRFSKLRSDPLNLLKDLPNLMRLGFGSDAYDGETLHFEVGFLKLERLYIAALKMLNSIVIDNGALPSLKFIRMDKIPQLKEMPSDFHHLQNLDTLYLNFMPLELHQNIDPENGPKYWVIKHVEIIIIRVWVGPGHFDYSYRTIRHPISNEKMLSRRQHTRITGLPSIKLLRG